MTQATTMQLEIVSAEASLFSGQVKSLVATGTDGEIGIHPGHTALLTSLKPGQIKAVMEDDKEEIFYMSGGMLEVQPEVVTILADTALRAADLDGAAALAVKEEAEKAISEQKSEVDYSRALTQLAEATAQLKAIDMLRKIGKRS